MFESLSTRLQDVFKTLRGGIEAHAGEHRGGAPRDSSRAARSGRQLQGRQGLHRPGPRPGDGRGHGRDVLRRLGAVAARSSRSSATRWSRSSATAEGGLQPTSKRPRVILMLGLQGAGKTTTSGKLAVWLTKQGNHPLLVSTDVKRPAAIQQLNVVAEKAGCSGARSGRRQMDPVARAKGAVAEATTLGFDARHRRHGGPPAHRRRADERAGRDQERDRPVGPAVCRRCDDRAGRASRARASSTPGSASPASC